jgi:hypothetical protein
MRNPSDSRVTLILEVLQSTFKNSGSLSIWNKTLKQRKKAWRWAPKFVSGETGSAFGSSRPAKPGKKTSILNVPERPV